MGLERRRPRLVHLATSDMTLSLLLGPQLRAFAEAGYEVIGVSARGRYVEELEQDGLDFRELRHATRAMALADDVRSIGELAHLLRTLRPDIVHTHTPKPGYYGRLVSRLCRVPVIVHTVHGIYALPEDPLRKRALVYGLDRIASAWSDIELLQNPEDLPVLRRLGIPMRKLRVLGNGVDLDRFDPTRVTPERRAALRAELGVGPGDVVCGAVGRLVWEKGYREVFAAARALRDRVPELKFVIVGGVEPDKTDGVPTSELERVAAEANVTFTGLRDDVDELYAAMDLCVLASYREGFPRAAMEAAAMGLPLVVSDIRGCRQVVDHGRNGLRVPARDATALTEALAEVATDTARRSQMGEAAIAKAHADFDQRRVIDITLDTYAKLLAARGLRFEPEPPASEEVRA